MEILDYQFAPGFRRRDECVLALRIALGNLSDALRIRQSEETPPSLQRLPDCLFALLYAQCLTRIEIASETLTCRIHFNYLPSEEVTDELDFSMLSHVAWSIETLFVRIVVDDVDFARTLLCSEVASLDQEDVKYELTADDVGAIALPTSGRPDSPEHENPTECEVSNEYSR
ncbi:MAG: hypothetical protein GDA67_16705 [Nitrospira sp. CR1.3]|nr:hypothetical protein [Nitrospira sp. CR1.3]